MRGERLGKIKQSLLFLNCRRQAKCFIENREYVARGGTWIGVPTPRAVIRSSGVNVADQNLMQTLRFLALKADVLASGRVHICASWQIILIVRACRDIGMNTPRVFETCSSG